MGTAPRLVIGKEYNYMYVGVAVLSIGEETTCRKREAVGEGFL